MLDFTIDEEKFNALDETVKEFYQKQNDGGYQLTINSLPSVDGLKNKNTELLGEMKKERELRLQLEEQLANFEVAVVLIQAFALTNPTKHSHFIA